jgi:hypothetical protein
VFPASPRVAIEREAEHLGKLDEPGERCPVGGMFLSVDAFRPIKVLFESTCRPSYQNALFLPQKPTFVAIPNSYFSVDELLSGTVY